MLASAGAGSRRGRGIAPARDHALCSFLLLWVDRETNFKAHLCVLQAWDPDF